MRTHQRFISFLILLCKCIHWAIFLKPVFAVIPTIIYVPESSLFALERYSKIMVVRIHSFDYRASLVTLTLPDFGICNSVVFRCLKWRAWCFLVYRLLASLPTNSCVRGLFHTKSNATPNAPQWASAQTRLRLTATCSNEWWWLFSLGSFVFISSSFVFTINSVMLCCFK